MKLTINRDDLVPALAFCRTVLRSGEAAILSNCLLLADGDLRIASHGLYSSKEARIPAKIFEGGSSTIPLDALYQIANGAPKGQAISIVIKERAVITWGRSRYTLGTLPVDGFPKLLSATDDKPLALDAVSREALFARPSQLLLTDDANLLYAGTWLHERGGKVASISSDGTRMLCPVASQPWAGRSVAMVPRTVALEIARMAAERVWWDKDAIVAEVGKYRFSARLLDIAYGAYATVVPTDTAPAIEFNRPEFVAALQRLGALANHGSVARLKWDRNPKSAILELVSGDGSETVSCSGKVEAGILGLAPIRACGMIEVLLGDKINFHIGEAMRPVRITCPAEPEALVMLAPCRVAA